MIKLGIIEDDRGIRNMVCEFLNMQEDMACVVAFDNVEDFLEDIDQYHYLKVLLLDINLPNMLGIDAIKPIKKALPDLEIIMLTIHSSSEMVFQALCAGATGYLLKSTKLPDIAKAVKNHHEGGSAMSPTIARMVIQHFSPIAKPLARTKHKSKKDKNNLLLTPKEMQVLEALADGLSYKLIAARLQMSPNTLPVHIRKIYKKLQINSKAEAIAIYLKQLRK